MLAVCVASKLKFRFVLFDIWFSSAENMRYVKKTHVRLVDSAPITLITYTRGKRCRSVVGSQFFGVVSSKKAKFFGLRLHLTTTDSQVIIEWPLAPAANHDGKVLEELVFNCSDLWLIGDKAYNDTEKETRFWQKRRILLLPLRKNNHHEP